MLRVFLPLSFFCTQPVKLQDVCIINITSCRLCWFLQIAIKEMKILIFYGLSEACSRLSDECSGFENSEKSKRSLNQQGRF